MKKFLFIAVLFLSILINNSYASSGDTTYATFRVNGNATCKSNIESAINTKTGVLSASWDASTKTITVNYVASQVQLSDLYTSIAVAGYDTAVIRAKQVEYDALSSDCKYTRDPVTD